ncbi:MAG: 50S ribosomal protein P1, partial [Candidatus Methanoperedens sp.]|nr:50S ribosomal protein P1 [Candidatus Methanoperedens sp.]
MEYVYAALLLHSAGKKITEEGITSVIKAAGVDVDAVRVKALVSA